MVTIERFPENMGNIALGQGKDTSLSVAIGLFSHFVVAVRIVHVWATGASLHKPRQIQNILDVVILPAKWVLFRKAVSKQQFHKSEISSLSAVRC